MKTKMLMLGSPVIAALAIAFVMNRQSTPELVSPRSQPAAPTAAHAVAPPIATRVQPPPKLPKPDVPPASTNPASSVALKVAKQTNTPSVALQAPPANSPQRKLQDPLARVALAFVGQYPEDPDAEAYWADAIFDQRFGHSEEREDLMEDLNEVGFADPEHPGPQDLPLIENRIAIIEKIAPYATPYMLKHLGEAWKDLNNMEQQVLSGQ